MRTARTVGGRMDVMGEGALLLRRPDTARSFLAPGKFVPRGRWTSGWLGVSSAAVADQFCAPDAWRNSVPAHRAVSVVRGQCEGNTLRYDARNDGTSADGTRYAPEDSCDRVSQL
jgi:hypothetical protein